MNAIPTNVVLLGANSDIGAVIGRRVGAAGHRLLAVSRSPAKGGRPGSGEVSEAVGEVDLLDEGGQARLLAAVNRFLSGAGSDEYDLALIHSVGDFWHHRPLDALDPQVVRSTVLAHYSTLAESVVNLLPALIAARSSRIIAFSCNSVTYSYPHLAPFTAAKAAIETFMRCVANEYSAQHVATTTIALPTVRTRKVEEAKPQGDRANYVTPEEVADLVLQEVTASPLVTGNVVRMIKHSDTFYGMGYLQRNPPEA